MTMPSMTDYDFGDVVLVAFRFTNLQATKKRPAVIISSAAYQQNRPDVILLAISSQIRQPLAVGEAIMKDWPAAGLAKPSVFKPLIAAIEQSRIVKVMGALSESCRTSLERLIRGILGQ